MKTLILAHYYTTPDVQEMADYVGDSLELAKVSVEEQADRIVFAGVRFMAETAKILNPNAEVILPSAESTCSLVEQTDPQRLKKKIDSLSPDTDVVTYINSSAQVKALSDYIVTSRNVEDIVTALIERGRNVYFTPDRNMGAYLAYSNPEWGEKFDYWDSAVCIVHDQFKEEELDREFKVWTDGPKYLIAHPESPLPVLSRADYVGSTKGMLEWVNTFKGSVGTIYVATEEGLLYNMRNLRPDLDIRLAPMYTGCQCNACPYMKMNTKDLVEQAVNGSGLVIDYLSDEQISASRKPIDAMMNFK